MRRTLLLEDDLGFPSEPRPSDGVEKAAPADRLNLDHRHFCCNGFE
jgi:hypothetical protein